MLSVPRQEQHNTKTTQTCQEQQQEDAESPGKKGTVLRECWVDLALMTKSPLSSFSIATTSLRIRTSTPLSAAFSASAIVYSYGISVPASGENSAAVASWKHAPDAPSVSGQRLRPNQACCHQVSNLKQAELKAGIRAQG
eukprot:3396776-Rhodomonas_salina.1